MAKLSAGILLFRWQEGTLEVLLVHPGGPFWARKDAGAWSIPKGEYDEDEDAWQVARREFEEETGMALNGEPMPLGRIKQPGGKVVTVWAVEGDCDAETVTSNKFSLEWPPKSGKVQDFPEVDRAAWFPIPVARTKILKGQAGFLEQLAAQFQDERKPSNSL